MMGLIRFKMLPNSFQEFDAFALCRGGSDEGMQGRRIMSELLLQLTHQHKRPCDSHTSSNTQTLPDVRNAFAPVDQATIKYSTKRKRDQCTEGTCGSSSIEGTTPLGSESAYKIRPQQQLDAVFSDESSKIRAPQVVVIAATNRIDDLDPAILRRFDCKVYVGVPEHSERVEMIKKFLSPGSTCSAQSNSDQVSTTANAISGTAASSNSYESEQFSLTNLELEEIADATFGWSGAEIEVREVHIGKSNDIVINFRY